MHSTTSFTKKSAECKQTRLHIICGVDLYYIRQWRMTKQGKTSHGEEAELRFLSPEASFYCYSSTDANADLSLSKTMCINFL